MAIKFSAKLQTAVITHPKDDAVRVTVKRIPRLDLAAYQSKIAERSRVVALLDQTGKPLLDEKTKKPLTETVANISLDLVIDILEASIVSWEGIENESGSFGFAKGRAKILFEEAFDVDEETKDEATGEVEKSTTSFAVYIMNRVLDGATFGDVDSGN